MLEFTFVYGNMGYELSKDLRNRIFGNDCFDESEDISYHIVGYDKTRQIAVGRLTIAGGEVCSIGFVAVDEEYRRQYVGDLVIKAIEDKARTEGCVRAELYSPDEAVPFFEFENYKKTGEKNEKNYAKMGKNIAVLHKCGGCK